MQDVLAADRHDDYLRAPDLDAAISHVGHWSMPDFGWRYRCLPFITGSPAYWPGAGYFWYSDLRQITQR